ncbi:MAG: endonuclease MutS2 [Firmicutes bacterium]|nr:endonuclease MutS2 [Bacillota bacterium]
MNERALKILEFNKIIDKLTDLAISPMGKDMAASLKPMEYLSDIKLAQKETTLAANMALKKGRLPLGGLKDIRSQIKRACVGGVLNIEELLNVGQFLYVTRRVKNYATAENKDDDFGDIGYYFDMVKTVPDLEKEINRCIISETEISDDASAALRDIRKNIKVSYDRIKDKLNSIIYSQAYKNMLQDAVITVRNDRYCVPVKSEYRGSFPGITHDQSNTGSTLFIEPMSVVEINNNIRELMAKEKAEIEKILMNLSVRVSEHADELEADMEVLTHLDFIFAKAELSFAMEASEPNFNENGYINIRRGRHPLLDKDKVVPIDIYLGKEFTTLLITGPNTGGKTVALKTLGLFTLMGQSGLHIPAFDNSELAVFDEVFPDIGDEQSIEQSLSTFSAHMTNIINILDNVTDRSLVLFDELGAGTDPTEGAALAMSIIETLRKRGIRTAVTTHYSELKVYALSTDKVENACCEFSVETLRPTYRLLIGIPGKSNAFAISKKLGLSDGIISMAKDYIDQENIKFEDVITDLEISKRTVVIEQERAEQYRKQAEALKKEVETQRAKTREQKEKILNNAREEAKLIYQKAKEEADSIIKELNRQAKNKANSNELNDTRRKLKDKINSMNEEEFKAAARKRKKHEPPKSLKVGDKVYIVSFDQHGTVLTAPDANKEVMVQMGIMKVKVPMAEVAIDDYVEKEQAKEKKSGFKMRTGKSQYVSPEIDCRGQLVEEALGNIDKYIDDAYLAGLKQVTIIHGKGTGALRSAVQVYLRKNPHVKSYRYGLFGEGEMGVTVVELK